MFSNPYKKEGGSVGRRELGCCGSLHCVGVCECVSRECVFQWSLQNSRKKAPRFSSKEDVEI